MSAQRWKLVLEYDGSVFKGWQRQEEGVPTVQSVLEEAINGFCQQRLTVHVAGRTDAGVHAYGQVCHFDLDYGPRGLEPYGLVRALNAHLADWPLSVLSAEPVDPDFHARFSARNKLYIYRVLNRLGPPVLEAGRVWHVRKPLDVLSMRRAAQYLLGAHDFSTFRAAECQAKTPNRTLDRLDINVRPHVSGDGVEIDVMAEARSFLHHQVRNMVGTLMLVAEGKWAPEQVKAALDARDRTQGGPTAPPEGLYLVRVDYV